MTGLGDIAVAALDDDAARHRPADRAGRTGAAVAAVKFELPDHLVATVPAEARGGSRDRVRLLVARPDGIDHVAFADLPAALRAGDLLVVNTSATIPAALDGMRGAEPVTVHLSAPLDDGTWAIELRTRGGAAPRQDGSAGQSVSVPGGTVTLRSAYPDPRRHPSRLWRARIDVGGEIRDYLSAHGRPITYGYLAAPRPLADHQTIFARHPGSAEMPSAARPFTHRLVTELVARGVALAPLLLHTGVSSPETGEPPYPERFDVPPSTAALVGFTRRSGGRVIAVGTTVVRALESAARGDRIRAARGWTDLVLSAQRPAAVVDGLITGWHPPGASHLALLEAVAGADLVQRAYDAALANGYLWHEFGDSCLFLPERGRSRAQAVSSAVSSSSRNS